MKEYVEDTLMQFLKTRLEPFTLTELLDILGEPASEANCEDLASFFVFNQLSYVDPSFDGLEEKWISRAGLFTGKPLVVIPEKFEIVSGILIPGSRFVPFANPSLLPHELTFEYKGKKLNSVRVDVTPDEIYPIYRLFGDEYTPQYLALDNEENSELFSADDYEDPASFPVTAIDVRDLYWGAQFSPGDRIVAYLRDWSKGHFELTTLPASAVDSKKQKAWVRDFEDNLLHSFEIAGPGASMDEQLSFAWFLGQESLFTEHAGSAMEFLKWSKKVSIESYGVESRLWFSNGEIPAQGSWNMSMINDPVNMTEEALMHLALPLNSNLVESYILDALFRKETDISRLMDRMIPVRYTNTAFCVPVIARAVQSRFKRIMTTFNWFADHDVGVLRNRYVSLHEGIARFVFSIQQTGLSPEQIPDQGAVVLGQLMSHTVTALENLDFPSPDSPLDVEALWETIEGMEDSFFDTKTAIQEVLPMLTKQRFSIIKKEPQK
jgi:hypothetical protein